MKKIVAIILTAAMALSVTGCSMSPSSASSSASAASAASTEGKTGKKVGLLLPTLQSEFFINIADGVKKNLSKEGYTVNAASFDSTDSKAIEQIENFTVQKVDVIVAMVTDNACDDALKAAMDKGIKVYVSGVKTKYYDVCQLADNKDVGKKIAEEAADFVNKNLDGKAEVVAIVSTKSVDMANRSNSMVEEFQKLCPNSQIVGKAEYKAVGDGTAITENMLQQHPNMKVIISFSDSAAVEAVEVVKAAGKASDRFGIYGCDSTQQGLKEIAANGIFRGTVNMGNLVDQMSDITMKLLKGEKIEKDFVATNTKITAENVKDYLK